MHQNAILIVKAAYYGYLRYALERFVRGRGRGRGGGRVGESGEGFGSFWLSVSGLRVRVSDPLWFRLQV